MKALVTGGAGFLGSRIVQRLVERGADVTVFSRNPGEVPGARTIAGNLADEAEVADAIAGHDTVFHVAAKAGVWGKRDEYYQPNYVGTRNVLNACTRHGVKQLIYTSTPSVVFHRGGIEGGDESLSYPGKFLTHYAETKAMAEKEVLNANGQDGLRTVSLRPHLIWGKGDPHLLPRVIARGKAGKLKQVGDGTNRVDITHVNDAADAHIKALDNIENAAGKAYFISSETVELWPWLNIVLVRAGCDPITSKVSRGMAYRAGAILEGLWKVLGKSDEPPMTRFVAENLATSHWFKLDAAKKDLGYEPQWTGNKALDEYFDDSNQQSTDKTPLETGASHG
jgi:2-alkyl-3-oxoalkanoate reductase